MGRFYHLETHVQHKSLAAYEDKNKSIDGKSEMPENKTLTEEMKGIH